MSSDEMVVVTKRKTNKLCLDSQEQARFEAEEKQRQEQARLKKEQKRKRREQQARRIQEEAKRRLQQRQKYQNPQTMLLEDSDSKDLFERVERKIRRTYPEVIKQKEEVVKRRHVSESSSSDQQSDEDSEEQESQEVQKKKKVQKKVKKQKKDGKTDHEQVRQLKNKLEKVKIQENDPKERLVKQVAIRWWYCIPEWPPKDYNYNAQLKKLGYRLVDFAQFRMQQNLVNGLFKVYAVEGYVGVFRSKLKIIDIRPSKENAPTIKLLKSKNHQQLTNLLKKALKQQYRQLSSQKYLLSQQTQLLTEIERRLKQLS